MFEVPWAHIHVYVCPCAYKERETDRNTERDSNIYILYIYFFIHTMYLLALRFICFRLVAPFTRRLLVFHLRI